MLSAEEADQAPEKDGGGGQITCFDGYQTDTVALCNAELRPGQ